MLQAAGISYECASARPGVKTPFARSRVHTSCSGMQRVQLLASQQPNNVKNACGPSQACSNRHSDATCVNGWEPVGKHWLQQAARASCRPHVQHGMQGKHAHDKGPTSKAEVGNTVTKRQWSSGQASVEQAHHQRPTHCRHRKHLPQRHRLGKLW